LIDLVPWKNKKLYKIWLAQNEARDEPMVEDPDGVARRSLELDVEWQTLKSVPASCVQKPKDHGCTGSRQRIDGIRGIQTELFLNVMVMEAGAWLFATTRAFFPSCD
jgi:hypothetical protein